MRLKEVIEHLSTPDNVDKHVDIMNMEVEFCVTDSDGLELLSVYFHEGKILIDIGDE